ncbi:MAG: hypothetical protein II909_02135 [Kiritimatiellae bacterium]|nr:hypothetical protein [Kiritimatiellia bacterium]
MASALRLLAFLRDFWYNIDETRRQMIQTKANSAPDFVHTLKKRLFWDVDIDSIDEQKHRRFVIQRVFERGDLEDIRKTIGRYSLAVVASEYAQMRSLDPVTDAFLACICNS